MADITSQAKCLRNQTEADELIAEICISTDNEDFKNFLSFMTFYWYSGKGSLYLTYNPLLSTRGDPVRDEICLDMKDGRP